MTSSISIKVLLSVGALALGLPAQAVGDAIPQESPARILVHYGAFDPGVTSPNVPQALRAGPDVNLWLVQFRGIPTEEGRAAVRATGATIYTYMPDNAYIVRMDAGQRATVLGQPSVRWAGYYEPAFRLEPALLAEHLAGVDATTRRYNILMVDKHRDKAALAANILAIGGTIIDEHQGSPLFTVDLDGKQLLAAARFDQVMYIDRWTAPEDDMNNARIQGGGNYVETQGGYTGSGIRGHVYEGVEATHPDFNTTMTNVRSGGAAASHGHCTAGIIFGNGASHADARGMAPNARGYYTNRSSVTTGWSRNQVIDDVVNVHDCMFTTASWGGGRTLAYTTVSADADDIVFDHRIPWTQSQSNAGNQMSRPEAWGKNIISVGGVAHFNNSTASDDSWAAGNGSTGPAADGRIKPDLAAYYDRIHTSDRSGSLGYNTASGTAGNHYTNFGGTSGATPIVAGHNALAIQMYTDFIFNNPMRSASSTSRFVNRPYAQTLKALMIVGARQYTFTSTSTDNRREHQGWGFPNLRDLHTRRNKTLIVPESEPIRTGETKRYHVNVGFREAQLKVCMTYLEPMGNPASTQQLINDLSLRVTSPSGTVYWGNNGLNTGNYSVSRGSADTIDSVECVFVRAPAVGNWMIEVIGTNVAQDAHVDTAAVTDATFALVAQGGTPTNVNGCGIGIPDINPGTGNNCNTIPFGSNLPTGLTTLFARNNGGAIGGAVYFDVTVANTLHLAELDVNTGIGQGAPVNLTVYRTAIGGTYAGNETNAAVWTPVSHGSGVAEPIDEPTRVVLAHPLRLSPGTYGIALVANDFDHDYTNGPVGGQSFSDANLTVSLGSATNVPFTGSVFNPRTANIELYYRTDSSNYVNQRYQTIVRSSDLGSAGLITGLAFSPCASGMHYNSTLRVRMSHVSSGYTLSTTFNSNLPSPVTVLEARGYNWPMVQDHWNEIGLMNPFNYNGTSDVVIEILATGNAFSGSRGFRRATEPRLYAVGWTGAVPSTGTTGNAALKMRLQKGCANASVFGRACAGLYAGSSGAPVLGTNWTMDFTGAGAGSFVFQRLGFDNTLPTYPFNLTGVGLPECYVYNDNVATNLAIANAAGTGEYTLAIPSSTIFVGTTVYGQWLALNAAAPNGLSASDYVRIMVGTL